MTHTLNGAELPPMTLDMYLDGSKVYATTGGSKTGRLLNLTAVSTTTGSSFYTANKFGTAQPFDIRGPYVTVCAHVRAG